MMKYVCIFSLLFLVHHGFGDSKLVKPTELKNRKVKINSDEEMVLATEAQKATFKGNVTVVMGDMNMKCQILHVEYEEIKGKTTLKSLYGEGEVYAEETAKKIKAWCDRLNYNHRDETMTVYSNTKAKVIKEGQSFEAKSFLINLKSGQMNVRGSSALEIELD